MTLRDIRNATKDNAEIYVRAENGDEVLTHCGRHSPRNKNALNEWLDCEVVLIQAFNSSLTVTIDLA